MVSSSFPLGLQLMGGFSGFTLTLAIAIHNIPEGLCIALPIYYSKGSRFSVEVGWIMLDPKEALAFGVTL